MGRGDCGLVGHGRSDGTGREPLWGIARVGSVSSCRTDVVLMWLYTRCNIFDWGRHCIDIDLCFRPILSIIPTGLLPFVRYNWPVSVFCVVPFSVVMLTPAYEF